MLRRNIKICLKSKNLKQINKNLKDKNLNFKKDNKK